MKTNTPYFNTKLLPLRKLTSLGYKKIPFTSWGLSANYNLGKNLIFQANYTFTDKRGTPKLGNHFNTFDLQVYARF